MPGVNRLARRVGFLKAHLIQNKHNAEVDMQDTFHGVIAFALMAGFLVIGGILRNRIPLCRNMLVPSGIIGGGIGLFLLSMGWIPGYQPGDFISLTFHFFTLSFMSLCLTGTSREASRSGGGILRGGMWLTIIWTISLGLQGVLGYLTIRGYNAVTGAGISEWLGAIVTHGFTQGPGQALTYGSIWENEYAIEHVTQIGLVYASLGFLVTFVVGVPLAKRLIRKGLNENKASRLDDNFLTGLYAERARPEMGRMISHPASLDSLAYHLGLLAIAYLITHHALLAAVHARGARRRDARGNRPGRAVQPQPLLPAWTRRLRADAADHRQVRPGPLGR